MPVLIAAQPCYGVPMQRKAVRPVALALVVGTASGCASQFNPQRTDPAAYASMSCNQLNDAIGRTSQDISAAAISRGKTASWNVPIWAPGGAKAVALIKDNRTAKIETLQAQQAALDAARRRNCR